MDLGRVARRTGYAAALILLGLMALPVPQFGAFLVFLLVAWLCGWRARESWLRA